MYLTLYQRGVVDSLPNNKFLDWSELKAFADGKLNVALKQNIFLGLVENIVGKEENAGYQHFLLFPQCFQKFSVSVSRFSELCDMELTERVCRQHFEIS